MGTGYTRNDTGNNIADGNIINASDLDGEFDALVNAFNETTGHTHDGTSAEGGPISKVGPAQDLEITTGALLPKTDNALDLGSATYEFKDLYIDGTANIDSLVADTADINGGSIDGVTIGTNAVVTDLRVDNIQVNGNAITSTDTNGNIDLTPNGTGEVNITKVDIDSGTIDGTIIGGASAAAGTFTTLNSNSTTTLNGTTIPASKTLTVTTDKLNVFAATTSSELAGVISDETGTGSLVFANTPTLVTPVLGTPTSGNLSNCTADGTNSVGYRNIPAIADKTAAYTLATGDVGKVVGVGSGGSIEIPNSTFAAGDAVLVFNNTTGPITITCTITTAYIAGTDADKDTVTLATRGVANILFLSGTACVITGNVS